MSNEKDAREKSYCIGLFKDESVLLDVFCGVDIDAGLLQHM